LQGYQNKTKKKKGYDKADITKVTQKIKGFPKSPRLQSSLGYKQKSDAKEFDKNMKRNCYVNTFSLKNWLKSPQVKSALLEGSAEELFKEFDFGELEPVNVEIPELCSLSS
jgi:hypothetical protein